jgi:glyceraldehyde-3-phosphate dehydrogenase (NADP+)
MTADNTIANIFPRAEEIPPAFTLPEAVHQKTYLIDGKLHNWEGPVQEVRSPVCLKSDSGVQQKTLGSYPMLAEEQAIQALQAAVRAYDNGRGLWPTMSVEERILRVEDFIIRMTQKRSDVVKLLMWEIGKSAADSEKEFDRTVAYIKDTIDALKELDRVSSKFVIEQGIIAQIRRAPLGVALCMGPYNYPLNETYTILIPALIMGNTVVFKPPKHGVLLHYPLLEAFRDSFPAGVVNTVYGSGQQIIPPVMGSGLVDCLGFIGSSHVADVLKHQHPKPHRLRCVFGLGAKNPAVILPDADLPSTVGECVLGALSYNGQRCTALKIIFVHESIAQDFLSLFSAAVEKLVIGMPWTENVAITPLPETGKTEQMADYVNDAVKNGAQIINPRGGQTNNTFFFPAVVAPLNNKMKLYHEEQFGPVVPVIPYKNVQEPIDYIINSNYGQQVSIFGKDTKQIAALIDPAVNQVCRVNLNSQCQRGPDSFPFTGRKDSAEGTLSISDALRVFSIRTLVASKASPINKTIINDIARNRMSKFLSNDFIL